ncbi:hypothetical protein [Zooshikella sp. RANM57]|uniref:hypothetical protein n=1 Tax=Zooshikella sp. RANM57 TaxID=3425863 RepID=UPI003D70038D
MNNQVINLLHKVVPATLSYLNVNSPVAACLMVTTAYAESSLATHRYDGNEGLGVYHISAASHRYLWDAYLAQHPDLASKVRGLASQQLFLIQPELELLSNLSYATAIAWQLYLQSGVALPATADPYQLAQFWLEHFDNGSEGKTVNVFMQSWKSLRDCHSMLLVA